MFRLQRQAGNRAVASLLTGRARVQRSCGCGCSGGGGCKDGDDEQRPVQRTPVVQRDDAGTKRDIAIKLSSTKAVDREAFDVEASTLTTAKPIDAATPDVLVATLKALPQDVGKVFIIGHSGDTIGGQAPEGKLIFAGGTSISISELVTRIGTPTGGKPSSISFRGCRIGGATKDLEALRAALGAGGASGSSCFVIAQVTKPVVLQNLDENDKPIGKPIPVTDQKQLAKPEVKEAFDREFEPQIKAQFEVANVGQVKLRNASACIIGLGPGGLAANRAKAQTLYFRNQGRLEAKWVRADGKQEFNELDTCFEDLTTTASRGCQLVEVKGGGGGGGGGGGKQACLPDPRPDIVSAAFAIRDAEDEPALDPALIGLRRSDGMTASTVNLRGRVTRLQDRLNAKGAGLGADGRFGQKTGVAVAAVQDAAGLPQKEVVDRPTAAALAGSTSGIVGLAQGDGLDDRTAGRTARVRRLQTLLTSHGSPTKVDGKFGPLTQGALNGFQRRVNLAASVIVDQATADVLEGRAAPPTPDCDPPILEA